MSDNVYVILRAQLLFLYFSCRYLLIKLIWVYFSGGCRISIKSRDGCFNEFSLSESLKPNEKMVITTLKTTEHGIQVTTRQIGCSGGAEKNATINDYVTKIDTFSGKVIDLH